MPPTRGSTLLLLSLVALLSATLVPVPAARAQSSLQFGSIQGPGVQAGVEKMAQGIAEIQNAANEKKQKLADAAGNAFDAVADAAGAATSLVRDKLGDVMDVTNVAGQWLSDLAKDYPADARQAGVEAAESLRATAESFRSAGSEILDAAKEAIPEFPSKDNLFNRNQWISKMALNRMYMDRFVDTVDEQFEDLFNGMEAKYCRQPRLQPSLKEPYGKLRFPGGFKLTLHTTECEIESVSHRDGTEIVCRKPRIEFEKYPARYLSKHHTPVKFESKLCKFEVEHGDKAEIVLATFDGKQPVDMSAVMKDIEHGMVDAFSDDFEDAGVTEFYRLLPELADVEADLVSMLVNSMPDEESQMAMYRDFSFI